MKISAMRKALLLANVFNLLVALYFIIIAIIALVQLRWYHQLTITVNVRYLLTSVTSYFAFFILIFAGLLLIAIFVTHTFRLTPKTASHVGPVLGGGGGGASEDAIEATDGSHQTGKHRRVIVLKRRKHEEASLNEPEEAVITSSNIIGAESVESTSVCCSIIVHLLATTCLVIILIIWLFNTGELVRDSISTQLDVAYSKYQFSNRSNHYTIAIDGMQDVNNCCGSLEYTDFPHQRISGLSSGHYPGSCCNKNIFGVNARVICTPEEIWRAKQTTGCTTILANYYDLMSILIVPVALVSMFVNITIIALITILKGNSHTSPRPASSNFNGGNHLLNFDNELQAMSVAGQRHPQPPTQLPQQQQQQQ